MNEKTCPECWHEPKSFMGVPYMSHAPNCPKTLSPSEIRLKRVKEEIDENLRLSNHGLVLSDNRDWKTYLREEHLHENPDENGAYTGDLLFHGGTIKFEPKFDGVNRNFYLFTQNSLEEMIEAFIREAREKGRRKGIQECREIVNATEFSHDWSIKKEIVDFYAMAVEETKKKILVAFADLLK